MSWSAADVGKKCKTASGKRGTVKWVGEGAFAPGTWIGIELATPDGKHDGEVKGKRYFKCKPKHGVMMKPEQVKKALVKSSTKKGTKSASSKSASKASSSKSSSSKTSTSKASATKRSATVKKSATKKKAGMAGVVTKAARTAKRKPGARPVGKAGVKATKKKSSSASALAAKRKALASARAKKSNGSKKTTGTVKARRSSAKAASPKKKEPDANELLRQKILAKLRGEAPELPEASGAGADAEDDGDDEGGNNLKNKIAARLAAIRNGASPPTSPRSAGSSAASSPTRSLQRSADFVPAHKRCTTKEQVAVLLQALCRGYLIRVEQFNLLDASVKLLRVEDNQWLVVGQGVAEVTDEVVPYVQVIGWKLDQRAWESTKTLLYETPIRPGETLTREDDGLGPPIYILNDEFDDVVRGLEFALPQDEETFEDVYAFARRDQAALIIQAAYRGAKVRWNLRKRRGSRKGARNPALPVPTATPEHHPPIGALIKVKRPMKKSKIGRLISYATFTGNYTIQYADKTREIDLDKTKYSVVSDESAQAPK